MVSWTIVRWCSKVVESLLIVWFVLNIIEGDAFDFVFLSDQLWDILSRVYFLRDGVGVELEFESLF